MKKVVGIVINVILWLFVVFAALTTVVVFTGTSNNGVGNLFGYMPFSIQTQSMEPTIKAGDVVIGKEVDFNPFEKYRIENGPIRKYSKKGNGPEIKSLKYFTTKYNYFNN